METMYGMHYTSTPKDMLLFTWWKTNTVQAVDPETCSVLWSLEGKFTGKPHGITTTGEGHVIIADGKNCRLLVLDAQNGELIQTRGLQKCSYASAVHFMKTYNILAVQHKYNDNVYISYYKIS